MSVKKMFGLEENGNIVTQDGESVVDEINDEEKRVKRNLKDTSWKSFYEQDSNKTKVMERMKKQIALKRIEKINFDILFWFRAKWLGDKSDIQDDKYKFYVWLESNYMEHLIAHQKHKKGHFSSSLSYLKKEARLGMMNKVVGAFIKFAIFVLSVYSIAEFEYIKNQILTSIKFSEWSKGAKIGSIAFVLIISLFGIVYFVGLFSKTEYGRQKKRLVASKETWLRHQEAVIGYQKEMLDYIWEIGDYDYMILNANRDRLLMQNIKAVWIENSEKFQRNMKR